VSLVTRYRIKVKSRKAIEADIPRVKQGWWADVCPGEWLKVRDATEDDLGRCFHRPGSTPADYFCEDFERGYLVPRYAAEIVQERK
jgi:hypothetical protein